MRRKPLTVVRKEKEKEKGSQSQKLAQEWITLSRSNPIGWIYTILGRKVISYQAEIAEAIRDNIRVSVRSCNSIGKDFIAGCIALWWVLQWEDAVAVTTAPTWHQVETIQWKREIHKQYQNSRVPLPPRMMTTEYRISPEQAAFGISTNNKEALQGIHSEHLLVIVTEASAREFDDELHEGLDALMAGGTAKMLLLSNPTRQEGQFYRSHHSEQDQWYTMHVGAFDTPNVRACLEKGPHSIPDQCELIVPGVITHEWVEDMRTKYGEDSDFWRVHVLGEFPKSGEDVVIPQEWIELALERSFQRARL